MIDVGSRCADDFIKSSDKSKVVIDKVKSR